MSDGGRRRTAEGRRETVAVGRGKRAGKKYLHNSRGSFTHLLRSVTNRGRRERQILILIAFLARTICRRPTPPDQSPYRFKAGGGQHVTFSRPVIIKGLLRHAHVRPQVHRATQKLQSAGKSKVLIKRGLEAGRFEKCGSQECSDVIIRVFSP